MSKELPSFACPKVAFGPVSAEVGAPIWSALPAQELGLAATGAAPGHRTLVRTAHDGTDWRVLFQCVDPDPWATLTERDAPLYTEETVEVFFDVTGDLESYYEIEVNPLGTVLDLVLRRSRSGYKGDSAWDCAGLQTAVRRTTEGWAAELAIPFASVSDTPPARWRVNFCRIDRTRNGSAPRELSAWSPPFRDNFHTPERFGSVEFTGL
jgi:hypothetical protein